MVSADRPLPIRLLVRLVTAVVAVAGLEVVGLGLYLAVIKPRVLETLLGDPDPTKLKMLVAGNGDVILIGAMLAVLGLAFAARSPTTRTHDTDSRSGQDVTDTSDEDATGDFAFGDGE